ncbi:conserved hypothetical protein [Sphingomonas sp. AX6]|nr:conserved hypothetical protein [Sphingomonas sp. AX6]
MTVEIDARGLKCPWPAIRLAKAMRDAGAPYEYLIRADDPAAPGEIERVAQAADAGFAVVSDGVFRIRR